MRRRKRVRLWKDARNEWRFKLVAGNGRTLAVSSEGYQRRSAALAALFLCGWGHLWVRQGSRSL